MPTPTALPTILIQSTSPTKQVLEVTAEQPFFLVFNESFHPMWKAHTKEKGKKRFFTTHSKVNGYANGYYIDKVGNYKITLEFTPQKLLNISLAVTFAGLALALAFIGIVCFKRKN